MLWWAVIPAAGAFVVRWCLWGLPGLWDWFHPLGILWFLLLMLPHELLHAAGYPQKAACELWVSPKNRCLFVICTAPVTKRRFVGICLLPAVVLGMLPLPLWCLFPALGKCVHSGHPAIGRLLRGLFNTQNVLHQSQKGPWYSNRGSYILVSKRKLKKQY